MKTTEQNIQDALDFFYLQYRSSVPRWDVLPTSMPKTNLFQWELPRYLSRNADLAELSYYFVASLFHHGVDAQTIDENEAMLGLSFVALCAATPDLVEIIESKYSRFKSTPEKYQRYASHIATAYSPTMPTIQRIAFDIVLNSLADNVTVEQYIEFGNDGFSRAVYAALDVEVRNRYAQDIDRAWDIITEGLSIEKTNSNVDALQKLIREYNPDDYKDTSDLDTFCNKIAGDRTISIRTISDLSDYPEEQKMLSGRIITTPLSSYVRQFRVYSVLHYKHLQSDEIKYEIVPEKESPLV